MEDSPPIHKRRGDGAKLLQLANVLKHYVRKFLRRQQRGAFNASGLLYIVRNSILAMRSRGV
jgi:hypothetical protein